MLVSQQSNLPESHPATFTTGIGIDVYFPLDNPFYIMTMYQFENWDYDYVSVSMTRVLSYNHVIICFVLI